MSCRTIYNQPNEYAWGSRFLIPHFLNVEPNGLHQAEIWLGTHPLSSAKYVDTHKDIVDDVKLRFLVKILAAYLPLSLQVHPSKEEAALGYDLENKLGIAIDAPNRRYKDSNHKPEMIIAIDDGFKALCGFKDYNESILLLNHIQEKCKGEYFKIIEMFKNEITKNGNQAIDKTLSYIFKTDEGLKIARVLTKTLRHRRDFFEEIDMDIMFNLVDEFPDDIGITVSTLMNHVTLKSGEALYLPSGNMHAYISGIGIEIMANSDNVLRGGLTQKHVDTDELLKIVDARILTNPIILPVVKNNLKVYTPVHDFTVVDAQSGFVELYMRDCVAVAMKDSSLTFKDKSVELKRGESVLIMKEDSCFLNGHVIFSYCLYDI